MLRYPLPRQTLGAICKEISETIDLRESRKKGRFIIKLNKDHSCNRNHGEILQFDCPQDYGPGDTWPFMTHYGEQVTIEVPEDVAPGQRFNYFVPHEQFFREEQEGRLVTLTLIVPEAGETNRALPSISEDEQFGAPAKRMQVFDENLSPDPIWVDIPSHLAIGDEFETEVRVDTGRPWSNQCSLCDLEQLKHHYDGMDDMLDVYAKREATALYSSRQDFADLDLKLVYYQQVCAERIPRVFLGNSVANPY